jgi:hypothetical protein
MIPEDLPPITNTWIVLFIFCAALAGFHLALVYWGHLDKLWWKRVDYIWLGLTALGLIGVTAQARQLVAGNLLPYTDDRVNFAYKVVQLEVHDYGTEDGRLVCRTFIRSAFSPPPDEFQRTQDEFNRACEWFKQVAAIIQSPSGEIDTNSFPLKPTVSESALIDAFSQFDRAINNVNSEIRGRALLRSSATRSGSEDFLTIFSPLLLALALALRITKVTGEIRLG